MPIAITDIKNIVISKSITYTSTILKNPFYTALSISIVVSIILIIVFQSDSINDRTIKLFKTFIYTFIITSIVIFLQTTILLNKDPKIGGGFIDPGILSGDVNAMAANKATANYVTVPLRPDLEQYMRE